MYKNKLFVFLTFAVFFSLFCNIFGQPNPNSRALKICYTIMSSDNESNTGYSDLEIKVMESFRKSLEAKKLFSENDFDIELLLTVKEIKIENKIAISVVEMNVLPKEAIEIGKKTEIFYANLDDKKKAELPDAGKFIREYMSEEYLQQFRQIWKTDLEIIELNDLDNFTQKIISRFL